MNVGYAILDYCHDYMTITSDVDKVQNAHTIAHKKNSGKADTVEISSDGYEIHFENSALTHRAVSRGYITVNGTDIKLSDEVKKKILKTSEEAFKANEKAILQYAMQHNAIVARQQAEAYSNEAKRMSRAITVMAKMASGGKVSEADKQFLAKYYPEMYAMAMSAAMMAERQERQEGKVFAENREESKEQTQAEYYAKELGDLKCEFTETTLDISLENRVTVGDVSTSSSEFL